MDRAADHPLAHEMEFGDETWQLLPAGGLFHPKSATLIVADLHLEKSHSFARQGQFLPPYDSIETLMKVKSMAKFVRPQTIISLGDGFHDPISARLVSGKPAELLEELSAACRWCWIKGNHDPVLPSSLPGEMLENLELGHCMLRHEPEGPYQVPVICGHLHPKAKIRTKTSRLRRSCFYKSATHLILPAIGAYTGGINVMDHEFQQAAGRPEYVWMLGDKKVTTVPVNRLVED